MKSSGNDIKVVLVTGGTGEIGCEIAKQFLENGERVFIAGRNEKKLHDIKSAFSEMSDRVYTLRGDISNTDDCENMVNEVISQAGRLDIVINCAGMLFEKKISDVDEDDWDRMLNTNLRGAFFIIKYAMPHLERFGGSIVNVGSTAGIRGFDADSVYCAAKGGMTLMTKALAIECAERGVRVNIVSPDMVKTSMLDEGFIRSGMQDREEYDRMKLSDYPQSQDKVRFIVPEDVAKAVLFLAYNEKSEAITGANLVIDFGLTAGFR